MEPLMIVNAVLLWIVVLLNILLTLALVRRINALSKLDGIRQPEMLKPGDTAPDFKVETLTGEKIQLSDLKRRSFAMVFVASGCGHCSVQMPSLDAAYEKAKKSDIELVVMSLSDIDSTRSYISELDYKSPILVAPRDTNTLHVDYKVPGTPCYYLVDREGKIKDGGFFDDKWKALMQTWQASTA